MARNRRIHYGIDGDTGLVISQVYGEGYAVPVEPWMAHEEKASSPGNDKVVSLADLNKRK